MVKQLDASIRRAPVLPFRQELFPPPPPTHLPSPTPARHCSKTSLQIQFLNPTTTLWDKHFSFPHFGDKGMKA